MRDPNVWRGQPHEIDESNCSLVHRFLAGYHSRRLPQLGHSFKSDRQTLAKFVVGQTSPEDAVRILDAEPYIRQNLPDGTIAWHWQSIVAGAYVGVTDNRLLILQFTTSDGGKTWRFRRVFHAQNIDLPEGIPFGSVAK